MLLLGSLVFYAFGEPVYVLLMLLSVLVNYGIARFIAHFENKKLKFAGMVLAIIYNVGLLLFFKYSTFFATVIESATGSRPWDINVALPLGISFYTFQILSYVADVYADGSLVETNIIDLGAYLAMFPQLIAGPIVVYKDVRSQIKNPKGRVSLAGFDEGLKLFTLGLGSKVIVANRLGQLWDSIGEMGYSMASTQAAWIGLLAFTLQIYFDFNGYSLMAIGLGRMLGFTFPENFDHPYTAKSVTQFWKKWHISLTSFFRNYVYIPLGGNKKGALATYRNMMIVWLITGFWHGADWNFIIWGAYYFAILSLERMLVGRNGLCLKIKAVEKLWNSKNSRYFLDFFGHIYAIFIVMIGWGIFAITDLNELWAYLGRLFAPLTGAQVEGFGMESFSNVMYIWLLAGCILASPLLRKLYEKIKNKLWGLILLFAIFWISIVQLVDSVYNPFLYFRF